MCLMGFNISLPAEISLQNMSTLMNRSLWENAIHLLYLKTLTTTQTMVTSLWLKL